MAEQTQAGAKPNNDASANGSENQNLNGAQGAAGDTLLDGGKPGEAGAKPAEKTEAQKTAEAAKATETAALNTAVADAKKALEADPENKDLQAALKTAEDKVKEATKPEGAPEKYEFKAADGQQFDPELTAEFSTIAKELNLTQENAQKLADFGPKILQKAMDKQVQQWTEIREGWVTAIKADKEFGGNKFAETIERAKRALGKFGDAGLSKLLAAPSKGGTGFGDNDSLIKFLARVDKATSEDAAVDGDPSGKDNVSAASVIYPNQGKP